MSKPATPLEERVCQMNETYEQVCSCQRHLAKAINEMEDSLSKIRLLKTYYTDGQFLQDYIADKEGKINPDLIRGVLSQDGLFDLFEELNEQSARLAQLHARLDTSLNNE